MHLENNYQELGLESLQKRHWFKKVKKKEFLKLSKVNYPIILILHPIGPTIQEAAEVFYLERL